MYLRWPPWSRWTVINILFLEGYYILVYMPIVNAHSHNSAIARKSENFTKQPFKIVSKRNDLIYVLIWTNAKSDPLMNFKNNSDVFVERKCAFQNCFVSDDKKYLGNESEFDVLVFAGPQLYHLDLPKKRTQRQIYVYLNKESQKNYPLCRPIYDEYFNWTWTYKLDSTLRWGYIVITDMKGEIIGPKKEMHWIKRNDMRSVDDNLRNRFKNKSKAVAWFVSHCYTSSHREVFAGNLVHQLNLFNLTLDIYGYCGWLKCEKPRKKKYESLCFDIIKEKYFFYLSFENSICEDYVTEKLLIPLHYNAIPVVLGGANYTRFLPDGSYLDALKLGSKNLAAEIYRLISNRDEYYEYFRWTYHYKYFHKDDKPTTDEFCEFCAALNNKEFRNKTKIKRDLRKWWSNTSECRVDKREHFNFFLDKPNNFIEKYIMYIPIPLFLCFLSYFYRKRRSMLEAI